MTHENTLMNTYTQTHPDDAFKQNTMGLSKPMEVKPTWTHCVIAQRLGESRLLATNT